MILERETPLLAVGAANLLSGDSDDNAFTDFDLVDEGVEYPEVYLSEGIVKRHPNAYKNSERTKDHDIFFTICNLVSEWT